MDNTCPARSPAPAGHRSELVRATSQKEKKLREDSEKPATGAKADPVSGLRV